MRFPIRGEPLFPSPTRLDSTSPSPTATESIPIADRCPSEVAEVPAGIDMRTIRFTASDGTSLYGVVVGAGDLEIALASAGPFCDEIQPATYLARHGNRVLAYEYRGHGESDDSSEAPGRLDKDVWGAVTTLRGMGSPHVVLVGSYGGVAAAVVAAPRIRPAVNGIVGFSPAVFRGQYINGPFGPESALQAAPRVRVPILLVTAPYDQNLTDNEVQRLFDAIGAADKQPLVVGTTPGWYLLQYEARVRRTVLRFLQEHA
jgi:pimeloyl-ACP methyl ester carboxylesterase